MKKHIPIGKLKWKGEIATIFFNGNGQLMTVETDNRKEYFGFTPSDLEEAVDIAYVMCDRWHNFDAKIRET